MCDALVWLFDAITGLPWLEVIKALAPVATAIIAYKALQNWKLQDKAKRKAEFLEKLLEAMHEYVALMPRAVMHAEEVSNILIASQQSPRNEGYKAEDMAFLDARQEEEIKSLSNELDKVRPYYVKVMTLATRGRIFRFDGYDECRAAIQNLTSQFTRIQTVRLHGKVSTLNWDTNEGRETLELANAIAEGDVRKVLREKSRSVLDYVERIYGGIYG